MKTRLDRSQSLSRQEQAVKLRLAGASYAMIADALGYYDASGVMKAVTKAIRMSAIDSANDIRQVQMSRLELLFGTVWPSALQNDHRSATIALSVIDRIIGINGLDVREVRKQRQSKVSLPARPPVAKDR